MLRPRDRDILSWFLQYALHNKLPSGPFEYEKTSAIGTRKQRFNTLEDFVQRFGGNRDIDDDMIRELIMNGVFQIGSGVKRTLRPTQ